VRIALICREYPPGTIGGGIGTYAATLAPALVRAGHSVIVLTRSAGGSDTIATEDGVEVHRMPVAPAGALGRLVRRRRVTFLDAYRYSQTVAARLSEIMDARDIDIVESAEHGAEGFGLMRDGLRVPHVVRFHAPLFVVNQAVGHRLSMPGRIVHWMERTTARRAALNTCPSRALATIVAARFGILAERIRLVPNPVDHELFRPAGAQPPRAPTVLYVGKVAPLKGARILAEAVPHLVRCVPEVRVVLIGSDHPSEQGHSTRAEMLAHLRRTGVASNVTFLPPMDRAALVQAYQSADVYVMPTLWDNFPNTCLEAMACGVPVVASAVGGLPEIINDGVDGRLVPPRDPERLAAEVVGLLQHPRRRVAMGQAARRRIETAFTPERVARETTAAYEEAVARFAAPRLRVVTA